MRIIILTPSLNQLGHLRNCVRSIRDQEVPGATIEQLVIDGGSVDGTVEWLRREGIPYVTELDNGMYDALNKGLAYIRKQDDADAIVWAWLNADEQYLPGALAAVHDGFISDTKADVLCGGALIIDEQGNLLTFWKSMPLRALYLQAGILYNLSCGLFFRARSVAPDISFDATRQATADLKFVQQCLDRGATARCLHGYTSIYTYAPSNISNRADSQAEHWILRHGGNFFERGARWGIRVLKAVERLGRGTRRERFPLSYDIYHRDSSDRIRFTSQRVPAGWPRQPAKRNVDSL